MVVEDSIYLYMYHTLGIHAFEHGFVSQTTPVIIL
jgi:hypothetical protein